MFSLDEGPGVLFKALAVFALRDINLTKVKYCCLFYTCSIAIFFKKTDHEIPSWRIFQIESRPQRKNPMRVVDDSNEGSARFVNNTFAPSKT